ncbi:MAG: nucleoside monophosphate kinase [Alphaproteobacteria bacterium]|nr:nucleoside monophosphate kinase [Alphaproteobacteria bacterium]
MQHNIVILLGVQGCGKGTVASGLLAIHDYDYIETGALFRGLDRGMPLGAEIGQIMESGQLVPDELTCKLVESKLTANRDILTDGFPRTVQQAEWLVNWAVKNGFITKAVILNIPREMAFQRIQNRLSKGGGRKDDADPTAVARRLDEYYAKTEPMVQYLRNTPDVQFIDIDGTQSIETVFENVKEKLK